MNFFNEIVDRAHKDGVKFTFDEDCDVDKCTKPAEWENPVTFNGKKITLSLCRDHQKDWDSDKTLAIKKEVVQK